MLLILAAGCAMQGRSQKLDASKVPGPVKDGFAKQYPKVSKVKWEMENGQYEATFKLDGNSMSTLQDASGKITETETEIKAADLPAAVKSYVGEHYKGHSIREAAKIIKADGSINYEAEVKEKNLVFDSNGKFIKEEKED